MIAPPRIPVAPARTRRSRAWFAQAVAPARTRRSRAWFALVIAAVLAAAVLWPAAPARAEIVDFDPNVGEAPEILTPDELARLDAASGAGLAYMLSDLSPTGAYVLAYTAGGYGFVDLTTGTLVPPAGAAPGGQASEARWVGDTDLGQINVEAVGQGSDQPPLRNYFWVSTNAASGEVFTRTYDVAPLDGEIVSAGPRLATMLVLKADAGTLAPRLVQIAPGYGGPMDDAPDNLPGLVQSVRLDRTLELQQTPTALALVDPDGSDRRPLFDLPADSAVDSVTWSDDGRRVAIVTRTMPDWQYARPRRDEPTVPGTPNLGSINVREALGLVPPDENPLVTGSRIHVFDVATGQALRTFEGRDFPEGLLAGIAFSPTAARALLVIGNRGAVAGRPHPTYAYVNGLTYYLLDADMASTTEVGVPGSALLGSGATFLDDDHLLFTVADETDHRLVTYDLATTAASTVWDAPGALYQFLARGERRVFSHSTVREPWELWAPEVQAGQDKWTARALTAFNQSAAESGSGLAFEPVSWPARGGVTLHGIYVHDADTPFPPAEPGPLVVWQAGGPGGQMWNDYGVGVESPYSVLPHFGLPVLIANAAGRTVKSPAFYQSMADDTNFGQLDIAQIRAGVDHLARRGIVHPGRVGITGCSYGGYFTWQSMRTYPNVYAAGNPQCSLMDLTEEFTFGFAPFIAYLEGRAPMADPAEYLADSPLYGVKDINRPMLIFHGTEDFLPVHLLTNAHDDLDMRGVDVKFLRVAGEGHGFGHPNSQRYAAQEQIAFFRRLLVEADAGPPPPPGWPLYLPMAMRAYGP